MDWIPDSFLIGADGVLWCFLGVGEIHSLRCTCRRMSHLVSKARPTSLICDMMCLIDKISMPTVWATLRTLRVSVDPKAGLRSLLCAIGHLPELSHLHVNHGRQFVDAVQHRVCDRGLADSVLDFGLPPFPRLQSLTIDLVTRRECLLIAQFWRTGCVMPNLQELSIDCSLVLDIREAPEVLVARITEGTHGLSLLRTLHIDASTMHRCDPVALLHTLSSPDTVQRLVLVLERITVANHRCQPRSVSHPPLRVKSLSISLNHTTVTPGDAQGLLDALRLRMPGLQEWQWGLHGCGPAVARALAALTTPPSTSGLVLGGCAGWNGLECLQKLLLQDTNICINIVGTDTLWDQFTTLASALQAVAARHTCQEHWIRFCSPGWGIGGIHLSVLSDTRIVARLVTPSHCLQQINHALRAVGLSVVTDPGTPCKTPLDSRPLAPMHAPTVSSRAVH